MNPPAAASTDIGVTRERVIRWALQLEYFTIGWNVIEGVIAISAALAVGSVVLLGFGVDSFVEVSSSLVMFWRLRSERNNGDPAHIERIERMARKGVAATLFFLAAYISYESVASLWFRTEKPEPTAVGIGLAAVSMAIMWWVGMSKRRNARRLHSHAMEADATQTTICWWLSVLTLTGIGLNALFGWWWADPVAGLALVAFVAREGWNAFQGKDCCGILPVADVERTAR